MAFVFEGRLPVAVLSSTTVAPCLMAVRAASFYRLNFLRVRPYEAKPPSDNPTDKFQDADWMNLDSAVSHRLNIEEELSVRGIDSKGATRDLTCATKRVRTNDKRECSAPDKLCTSE